MKKTFRTLHLWLSIPFGIFITIICLTGASLVFEQEITNALNPHLYYVTPPAGAQPLQPSQLAQRIKEQMPDTLQLSSIQFYADEKMNCMASFKNAPRRTLSVNPYTGEVNGWTKSYAFFQTMRKLHRYLMDSPASRGEKTVGKVVVGISTLMLVVILITGVVIWFPSSKKALKNRLSVSCTKGWFRFWYDSHVSLGIYVTIFLLFMALTGLTWSFNWYRTAAYSLFGGAEQPNTAMAHNAPAHENGNARESREAKAGDETQVSQESQPEQKEGKRGRSGQRGRGNQEGSTDQKQGAESEEQAKSEGQGRPEGRGERGGRGEHPFNYAVWDNVLSELKGMYPVFKTITLSERNAQIAPNPKSLMRRTDTATFNPRNGEIKEMSYYKDAPRSQALRGWFYSFHTGNWGGMITKIIYFLSALIGGILPLSGYYMWLRKKKKKHA
ncbi:MAG: PepSY-associated TM helix domain-containing protein [Bacteroidales bacterium]|nr:PepSY-associated TM helix domain-containing protein [Bacteroidales bacterium]